jgi:hypothetical protein
VIEGSMGQSVPNKLYGEAEKSEKMAFALERVLLLTARERQQAGSKPEAEDGDELDAPLAG